MITILTILKMMISQFKESAVFCAEPLQLFPLMAVALLNKSDIYHKLCPQENEILKKNL